MNQDLGHPRRWRILAVLVGSLMAIIIDTTILNVSLKTLADPTQGLGATHSELEWALSSYTLVFAALLFSWGVLADRVGRKRVLSLGLALFGLASVGSAYSQDAVQLIVARSVMGVGAAAVMPCTLAIIAAVVLYCAAGMLGIGMGSGDKRAIEAAEQAVASPLLETSMEGARKILLSITGGKDLSLWEVSEAAKAVGSLLDHAASQPSISSSTIRPASDPCDGSRDTHGMSRMRCAARMSRSRRGESKAASANSA